MKMKTRKKTAEHKASTEVTLYSSGKRTQEFGSSAQHTRKLGRESLTSTQGPRPQLGEMKFYTEFDTYKHHGTFSTGQSWFLPRDAMRKRGICSGPVSVRLSLCLSVTLVHSIQTAEDIVKLLCRSGNLIIVVFDP